jgi:predicted acyltransferase
VEHAPDGDGARPSRIVSLDVLRGLTIAGMIVVNNPGDYDSVYAPLAHAEWNGWSTADLVFPFFLFIAGVAIPVALSARRLPTTTRGTVLRRVLRRSAVLLAIGIFLNAFPAFDIANVRLPGVLQRIALCYAASAIVFLTTTETVQAAIVVGLLLVYGLLLRFVPVPGFGAGVLEPEANLAAYVDRWLFGEHHLYRATWDPEGLLSTLPATATMLFGVLAGHWLRSPRDDREKAAGLVMAGVLGVVLGELLDGVMPINKNLWTSSFALLTAGLASLLLGFGYWIVDVREVRRPFLPLRVLGMNPIAVYVASSLLGEVLDGWSVADGHADLRRWLYRHALGHHFAPPLGSLMFALAYVVVWLAPMAVLYRKNVYIRI